MNQGIHGEIADSTPISIPMVDLAPLHNLLGDDIALAMVQVLERRDFIDGHSVKNFETSAARYLNVQHAFGVASGTDALLIALRAAGVGPGDEVITSPFSFWATAEAIHHAGAKAVYADIDRHTMNINPAGIEALITRKTRVILAVHIFGQSAAMEDIMALANRYDLAVIEDASHAFGATYRGQKAGSIGTIGCYSFYPSKPLGCFGDGGLVVTNDSAIAQRLKLLRNHGTNGNNRHEMYAYNSRLDSLQAAVLNVKLKSIDRHLAVRGEVAARYTELLADLPVLCPLKSPRDIHTFAQYTIRCHQREGLRKFLQSNGIATAIHYPVPLYREPANPDKDKIKPLPVTENACATCLSLPIYQGLDLTSQLMISDLIHQFYSNRRLTGGKNQTGWQ